MVTTSTKEETQMRKTVLALFSAAILVLAGCGQAGQNTQEGAAENVATAGGSSSTPQQKTARPAPVQQASRPSTVTVPEGTSIAIQLKSTLNSGSNQVGDAFTASVVEPVVVDGHEVIPAGSTVHGTVQAVTAAKRGAGNASMTIAFSRLDLPGGQSSPMVASMSQQTASKKGRNAGIIGGSAAGGALLGRILGKDTKGAVVGSIVGGAIGTGVVMSKEGAQVNLPAGTDLTIQLDEALKVPRR
jgi:hypothetical protein